MKSPLIPYGAGKGDKPRPVDKRTYDANYDTIFRSKGRRKDQGSTPPQLPGGGEEAPTQDPVATGRPRDKYYRRVGPDGQTQFVVAYW
jgi:hypothetical protein